MASRKSPDIPFAGEPDTGLDETQRKKSVLITNVPPGTKEEDLIIYFQKESNGGGEVEDAKMLEDGKALVIFDEEEVANRVLEREHTLNGNLLQLEPCFKFTDDMEVFSLVSAKLDPSRFTVDLKELNELLVKAQEETGVNFLETCEGFLVSGTLEQIEKSRLFLSRYAKRATPVTENSDNLQHVHRNDHPLSDSDDKENALKTLVLDVEPKLMQILQIKVNEIEKKFKMKIDWKSEPGKAHLSPNGKDAKLFEDGKEEFITLYQKEFPDLQEKDFPLDAGKSIEDIDSTVKALMEEFAVVIERKDDKNVHIFGKENDVAQVMQQLQGKFGKRRGRKLYKASSNGELPMPDTYAQAAMLPLSKTLDNGVVVSVHQGDITRVLVDVIVNAANESLAHGGGVAGAIVKQGGQRIQQESDALVRRYGCVPVGRVAYTGPGNLPYKRIYHAVGPQWRVHGEERSRHFIYEACMNSFEQASKHRMTSIALPGISSGIYGVPKHVCAEMMFAAAESFAADASSDNQLKDIRFVNIDTPTYEAFQREFHNRYSLMTKKDADLGSNLKDEDALGLYPQAGKERKYKRNTNQQMFDSTGRTDQVDSIEERERIKRAAAAADAAARRMEREENVEKQNNNENENKVCPKNNMQNQSIESQPEQDVIVLLEKLEINDDHSKREDTGKMETNENNTPEIINVKEKEKVSNITKSMDTDTDIEDADGKKAVPEILNEADESSRLKERPCEQSYSEINNKSPGDGIKASDRELSGKGAKKTSKLCGRGRGALAFTPTLTGTMPGRAVRQDPSNVNGDSRTDEDEPSEGDCKVPPGLKVSEEGLKLANTTRKRSEERKLSQEEDSVNARKKHLESEPKDTIDGVPPKKAKVDERTEEKEGGGSAKHGDTMTNINEKYEDPANGKSERDDDKEEVKEEIKTDMSGSDESYASKEDSNSNKENNEHDIVYKSENVCDQEKKEIKSKDDHLNNNQTEKISGMHAEKEEESSATSGGTTDSKEPMDSKLKSDGDGQSSDHYAKQEISAVPENATGPKPLYPNAEENGDDQNIHKDAKEEIIDASAKATELKNLLDSNVEDSADDQNSQKDSKDESSVASSTKADDPKEQVDSNVEDYGSDRNSHKDSKDERSVASAEAAEPKTQTDSNVEENGNDQNSHKDSKDESSIVSEEATEPNNPLDPNVKRGSESQAPDLEAKNNSKDVSSEAADPKKPLERDGDGESSNKKAEEESNTESAEAIDPNNVSNFSAEPDSMNSFVLLDMPSVDHDSSIRPEKTSRSSDESSESIELLNSEGDGFSDTSSSSPVIEQGSDLAQLSGVDLDNSSIGSTTLHEINTVSDSHTKATGKTVGSAVANNKDQSAENNATELEGGAGSSSVHQEADNTESIIKDNDHPKKISSVEDLSHDNVAADTVKKAVNSDSETTSAISNEKQECGVCLSTLDSAQLLRICDSGHAVCRNCFDNLQNAELNSVCPTCHEVVPRIALQPPNGQMKSGIIEKGLVGYESCSTIYVDYEFPEGTQGPFHPNPGTPYDKLSRRTFLPDNEEGRRVLDLLKKAFDASILFTVGKSTINDKDNQIIFNGDIDHKTNVNGGPKVGYPDPDYLDRVKKQLNAKGIESISQRPPSI